MQALVHDFGQLVVKEIGNPKPKEGEVVLSLHAAGLNHRDLFIPTRRGADQPGLVLGSDGAGVITKIGHGVTNVHIGDEVIVNPSLGWYENQVAPPDEFEILGMPDNGTIAEKIVISSEQVEKKPSYLSWAEAGVLAVSALTGYRALFTKGNITAGDTVFIPGAGSGVATYLILFAKSIGARVITSSRSKTKQDKANKLGADIVLDTNSDWKVQLKDETIDLIIESVGRATFNRSLDLLKKGGRIVVFGASAGDIVELNLRDFFYGQYQLIGTTLGSRAEMRDMLSLMEKYQIHPVIDQLFSLSHSLDALQYLKEGKQFGNIAIQIKA